MSEKQNNNDPLEQFFRQKAKDYDIQYKEEDWIKLENRLDEADRQYANRRRRRIAAAAVILLFAILSYVTYEQQQKINQLSEQLSDSENVTNIPNNIPEILPDRTTSENEQSSSIAQDATNPETTDESPVASSDKQHVSGSENEVDDSSNEAAITNESRQDALTNRTESNLVVTIPKASPGLDDHIPATSAIRSAKTESSTKEGNTRSQTSPSTSVFSSTGEHLAHRKTPRFSFGVLVGPDISTVSNISRFSNPGHKVGFSLEYKITQNLAISTGAQRTNVRYTAHGSEYSLPEGYLPYGTVPGEIAAQCILIDIPLSLKYDFLHFSESRMYATAGFSSYIMLDEDYRFNYENNQPGLPERWHQKTGTRHWMSNATISVGYELDVMRNISFRAEPFLKIPMKEVGWGNVNLYSMGSFFSINYKW